MNLLINEVPWTKLKNDGIWAHVAVKYMEPIGRHYHNMEHVVSLYRNAAKIGVPHDINLDLAILFHDVVYDAGENKEIRSAHVFANVVKNFTGKAYQGGDDEKAILPFGVVNVSKTVDAIMATINHAPSGEDTSVENLMVLLDLMGFADEKTRKEGLVNLMNEISVLYPKAKTLEVYENVGDNNLRLYGNLVYYVTFNDHNGIELKYRKYWDAIIAGIEAQVKEIKQIVELGKLNIAGS